MMNFMKSSCKNKRFVGLLIAAIFTLSSLFANTGFAVSAYQSNFSNFITVADGKLMDGDKVFRFIGMCVPNLHFIEGAKEGYSIPNDYEIEDAFKSLNQMGSIVIRIHTLAIRGPVGGMGISYPQPVHMEGPNMFNETAYRAIDKVLEMANKYNVRVIIPGFDSTGYWGGIAAVAAFRGKDPEEFWEDPQLREDAKAYFNYIINRTNYYTGVKYKDDKSIMAWQLGNELENYWVPEMSRLDNWSKEMSKYIKSLDPNHLVQDGRSLKWTGILNDPNMDIIDSHYYASFNAPDPIARLKSDLELIKGSGKVLMVGEFGFYPTNTIKLFLNEVINSDMAGALLWNLRFHSKNGGFYFHGEGFQANQKWEAYHWPGFPSGDYQDETNLLRMYREQAYRIMGTLPPILPASDAPEMLAITNSGSIKWRGSAGASSYNIERATDPEGPWEIIGKNVTDDKNVERGAKLFGDSSAVAGIKYYYRVKAINQSGESPYSNIIKLGDVQKKPDCTPHLLGYGLEDKLSRAVTLYIGHPKAYTRSGLVDLDSSDSSIVPIVVNGRTLVPVRFISENLGAKVDWDDATKTVTVVSDKGKKAELKLRSNIMTVHDSKITLDVSVNIIGGRTLIPLRALAENVLDKKVFYDRALIVISDSVFLNVNTDKMLIDMIIGDLFDANAIKPVVFPIPTPIPKPIPISKATEKFVETFTNDTSLPQFISKRYVCIDGLGAYTWLANDRGRLRRTDNAYQLTIGSPYANGIYKTERDITGFKATVFYTAPGYNPEYDMLFYVSSDNVNFKQVQVKKIPVVDTKSYHPGAYLIFTTENESPIPTGNRYLKIEWFNSFGKPDREPRWSPQVGDIEVYLNKSSSQSVKIE